MQLTNHVNMVYDKLVEAEVQEQLLPLDPLHAAGLRYEQLMRWAEAEWRRRFPDQEFIALYASEDCANQRARDRIKAGRKLKNQAVYRGSQVLDCPYAVAISRWYQPGRKVIFYGSTGAFLFTFEQRGETFSAIYACARYENDSAETDSIVLVSRQYVEVWSAFEKECSHASKNLERTPAVYVIGGKEHSFTPDVEWDRVILSDVLKTDLRNEIETFFDKGVGIYKQLGLPPFRKLLLVGPPGTGKSTLCAALAKIALQRKCIVVYISAADSNGASFDKIHRALNIISNSRYPVLLLVEELDIYLKDKDKSQILNVLDGMESPNNAHGALMIATTNYPEIIDERIAKRPGRIDRVIHIPVIENIDQAVRMLMHYMGPQWQDAHRELAPKLVNQTGAFVREVAVYARMLAANAQETSVSISLVRQSIQRLTSQLSTADDLRPRRPIGFSEPQDDE